MGSKSKSAKTSGQTQATMDKLAGGKVSNNSLMDMLAKMQGGQLGGMLPVFDAMMKNGNSMMGSNPMMQMFGGQQQAPQVSLSDIFQAMQPKPPEQPQVPQFGPMGQSGVGAMPNMTPDQIAAIQKMQGYGRR